VFYTKSSQTCSIRRQVTQGIIFKPEHLLVAQKTNAEDDRLETEVRFPVPLLV